MADKTVNTKIQLRYDTLTNWDDVSTAGKGGNYVPKAGEMCIVQVNDSVADAASPILFKVGDGKTSFSKLEYGSAKASDVYSWAKKSESEFVAWAKNNILPSNLAYTNSNNNFTTSQTIGGDVTAVNFSALGNIEASNAISAKGDITTSAGSITVTTGDITAESGIITGGEIASDGDITAEGSITVQNNISSLGGEIGAPKMSTGTLTATTGIKGAGTNTVKIPDESGTIITDADTSSNGTQSLAWGSTAKLATINGTDVKVTMPEMPSYSDTTYTFATGTNLGEFNVTPKGGKTQSVLVYGLGGAAAKGVTTNSITGGGDNDFVPTTLAVANYVADQISGKSSVAYVIDSSVGGNYCNTEFNIPVTETTEAKSKVELTSGTIKTIDGKEISLGSLKVGDIIYTKAAGIKDWFYSGSAKSGDLMVYTFYQISGDTPVLDEYVNEVETSSNGDYVSVLSKSGSKLTASKSSFNALSIAGIKYTPNAYQSVSFVGDGATTVSEKEGTVTISSPKSVTGVQFQINQSDTSNVTPSADGKIAFSVKGTNLTVTKEAAGNAIQYTISPNKATSTTLGAIKTGYTTSASNKNYKVDVDDTGNAYVNVPWSDTNDWRPIWISGSSLLSNNTRAALNLATGTSSTVTLTSSIDKNSGVGTVKFDVGEKVITTEDTLILNGGTATTVI